MLPGGGMRGAVAGAGAMRQIEAEPPIVTRLLADAPMTRSQWIAIAVCVLLNVIDGFDILVMATAAPAVKAEFQLPTAQLGFLLSAGLVGMTLGALLVAPIADRIGRRSIILVCLGLEFVGMLFAGFAPDHGALTVCRVVAGLGVGGMMPVINTATAEAANTRRRTLAITAQAVGYPPGGLIAAVSGMMLLDEHGWRLLLQIACIPTAAAIVLVVLRLPESIDFLLARRPEHALGRINRALAMLGKPALERLPPVTGAGPAADPAALVRGPLAPTFAIFTAATFCAQFSFYFFLSWLPTVLAPHLTGSALPNASSITLNLGGIVGDVIFAVLCLRVAARHLTIAALLVAFASIAGIALLLDNPSTIVVLALTTGAALFGAMAGIYATAPRVFPPIVRASGTGVAFAFGRVGGALAPVAGGIALAEPSLGLSIALALLAAPLLAAAGLLAALDDRGDDPAATTSHIRSGT
jgi:MFS family permease